MTNLHRKILVVDDDRETRIELFDTLAISGYQVMVAENGRMALDMLQRYQPDLLIADIQIPEVDGLELLRRVRLANPSLPVLVMTASPSVESAVEAMKNGALDYLMKPFPMTVIEAIAQRVFSGTCAVLPGRETGMAKSDTTDQRPVIGEDEKLKKLLHRAKMVASSKATVLITGESGTGKEVLARFIHQESDRRNGPFVALNCAALPEGLLESELFGHEKGAFTGAIVTKKGKFELADKGTLLLDEIAEIPIHLQAKLLRVLQEEEVDRVGGRTPISVDVHVLATTNRNLQQKVDEGFFREDLYYRLNVIPLQLPPLRERRNDILILTEYFIKKYNRQYKRSEKRLSPSAMSRFLGHSWPGNVRELENLVERAVLLSEGDQLEPHDFWDEADAPPEAGEPIIREAGTALATPGPEAGEGMATLQDVERQMIIQALQKTDNNRTHAAKLLGISVRTLRNKLNEYRNQGLMGW